MRIDKAGSTLSLHRCQCLLCSLLTDALCPSQYLENGGSCYRIAAETINWESAETKCIADGGHLASVSSQAENDYVFGLRGANTEFWIGLNDKMTEGTYVWTDGTAFSFHNWKDGQPKWSSRGREDCVRLKETDGGKWNDKQCAGLKPYVCERGELLYLFALVILSACVSRSVPVFVSRTLYQCLSPPYVCLFVCPFACVSFIS